MEGSSGRQAEIARKTWEMSNNVMEIQPGEDIYRYDKQQQQSIQAAKPWDKDPHFFKVSQRTAQVFSFSHPLGTTFLF